jgi:predicted permease
VFQRVRSFLRVLTSRRDFEAGMNEELRFHIEQYAEDLTRSGLPREEALRRARMEFGAFDAVRDDCREARGLSLFDELARDLRYSVRTLRKSAGFTATALLTLAVCLGANLTIFAVIDAILVRALPFLDAGRLVTMYNTYPKAGVERDGSSLTNYYERRGRIPAFSSLSIYRYSTSILGEPGATERKPVMLVSPDFFTTLGADPAFGRIFTDAETTYQTDDVAIVSDAYWKEYLNADPQVIGRKIPADGHLRAVIGVLPPGFRFLSSKAQLYFPLASRPEDRSPAQRHSGGNVIQLIARLKPGASLAQAQSQIDAQNLALERDDPKAKMMADAGFRTLVVPLRADQVATIRPTLLLLEAGVLVLLAIGAVNLVNLLLIRASGRSKEIAVRQALGASRTHVVTEAVVETTLLTLTGGLLALAMGAGGIRLMAALGANRLPLGTEIHFDARLAMVAFAAAVILGVVLAAPIAWFSIRLQPSDGLQSEARGGTAGRAAQTVRHSFVVAQIALAFVLLTGTGLLGLSLKHAMDVSPGFRSDHVITGQISLVGSAYRSPEAGLAFTERLVGELGHQPGIVSVGVVNNIPFSGANGKSAATALGYVLRHGQSPRGSYSYGVAGDYFSAMGFSLREGRFLTGADSRRGARVCVVDRNFARYYWPNTSALGHRLFQGSEVGSDAQAFTVVGVVGSIKQSGLTDDSAQGAVYYPYIYRPESNIFVAVRGSVQPDSLQTALRTSARRLDPELAVADIQTMDNRIADSLVGRRSPAVLAGAFSAIALLLIAIGTYGVLSYAVAQRRREIGVRMALGARPQQIGGQFLWLALRLLAAGTILGIIGAWITGQAMRAVLFHVPARSPAILIGSAAVIAAISFFACLLPARRAARISPIQALADQ